jgi:type IV pilus assembly protein PilM
LSPAAWLRRTFLDAPRPAVAVEVRARSVGVVRRAREGGRERVAAAVSLELPEGAVRLGMAQPNLADPDVFRRALAAAVERAGVLGGGPIALVLPDPVARVSLVPASEVPARRSSEVEAMLRFRLRKAVPFEIDHARISFVSFTVPGVGPTLLAVALFLPVLEDYEKACQAVGLHPGIVELAGLALLRADEGGPGDRLVVNWDDDYVSLYLVRDGWPILVRVLAGDGASAHDLLLREAATTLLYYQERLGGGGLAGAAVRSTVLAPAEAAASLEPVLGLRPAVLAPWGASGLGDAAQGLAGAAASVLGRVA